MRPRRLIFLVLAIAMLGGACKVRTEVNVTVAADGSGTVELAAAVDDEALEERPDLFADLRLDHLVDAGWEVSGPSRESDGLTWVRARQRFARVDEVGPLVDAAVGEDGPFRDFSVQRSSSFATDRVEFSGTVDFTAGLGAAAGDGVGGDLPGDLPGEVAAAIDEIDASVAAAVDESFEVQVAVRLPGDVSSNAPTQASNGAIWRPSVLAPEPVRLSASGATTRTGRVALAVGGGVLAVAAVLATAVALAAWRRRNAGRF